MRVKLVVVVVVLIACIVAVAISLHVVGTFRAEIQACERERLAVLKEIYEPSGEAPQENQLREMGSIYADIVAAYTNEDSLALRKSIARLPAVHDRMNWQVSTGVKFAFVQVLNETFLRARQLRDFTTVEDFNRYMTISLEAARFYGESEIRRKEYEFPIAVEYLALNQLRKYCEKFQAEGRNDLAEAAARQREFWIARIESRDGLTRQCAEHALRYNTIYIKALKPERSLTREQGVLLARQTANGLINCGYRPKWLDAEYPDLGAKEGRSKSR